MWSGSSQVLNFGLNFGQVQKSLGLNLSLEPDYGIPTSNHICVMDAHILSYFSVFYMDLFDKVFMFESLSLDMIR